MNRLIHILGEAQIQDSYTSLVEGDWILYGGRQNSKPILSLTSNWTFSAQIFNFCKPQFYYLQNGGNSL